MTVSVLAPLSPPAVQPVRDGASPSPGVGPAPLVRAGIYVRISRDKVGAGLGVARQEVDCRELAACLGWTVADVYADNDISAYSGRRRPAYERMLADIAAGKIAGVIAWHGDRLHRRPTELESYIDACEARGVATQTVKAGNLDLSTPSGRMIARQLGTIARYEVEHAIERIRGQKDAARANGEWLGGRVPFGFDRDGKASITVNESEAAVIRQGAADVLAGASAGAVARGWNAAGWTTRAGRPWKVTSVRETLCARRNGARVEYRGEDAGPACWAPILDADTYEGVRAVLNNGEPARRYGPRTGKRLLTGVGRCGVCGAHVTVSKRVTKGSATATSVYRCSTEKHIRRAADPIDEHVTDAVIAWLSRPEAVELLTPDTSVEAAELRTRQAALQARKADLGEAFAAGEIDRAQLKAGTERLRADLAEVDERLAALSAGSVLDGLAGRPDAFAVWAQMAPEQRRAAVDAVATVTILPGRRGGNPSTRVFDPSTVRIEWRRADADGQ